MKTPWKILEKTDVLQTDLFHLRKDRLEMPSGKLMPRYFVMEFTDWLNVIPVTRDREIVMVEQYRHSLGQYTLEFPGGTTKKGEDPFEAGRREMEEETGYTSNRIIHAGKVAPNPALQNNFAQIYVAFDCEKTKDLSLDPFEDIQVLKFKIPEVIEMVQTGQINHSIMAAGLFLALPHLGYELALKR